MYKIITKTSRQVLSEHYKLKDAEEEIKYITEKCDLYKKEELKIVKY